MGRYSGGRLDWKKSNILGTVSRRGGIRLHSQLPSTRIYGDYYCQAGKHPINLQGDFFYGRGGGPIFSARTQNFHFGPFFVMDDLDSSNFAWEWHQSSPGSATRQTKIQVVAVFLLIF